MLRLPVTVISPVNIAVLPPPAVIVKFLKLDAPIWGAAPVKLTVPVAVNVPDSTHVDAPVPVTVIVLDRKSVV